MAARLNGWRRIGVVLVAAWCIAVLGTVVYEWKSPPRGNGAGLFVFLDLPRGMFVPDAGPIQLPDGRTIQLQHRAVGDKPWEIDWAHEPDVRDKALTFRWASFLIALLVAPAGAWVFAEWAVRLVQWVSQGFKRTNGDP